MEDKENFPPTQDFGNIKIKAMKDRINADRGMERLREYLRATAMDVDENIPTPDSPSGNLMPNLQGYQSSDKFQSFEKPPILANYVLEDSNSQCGCLEIHPLTVFFTSFFFGQIKHFFNF